MILISTPGIDQRFRHDPQLYSRLGFSHRYRALDRDELLFVLDRHWKRLASSSSEISAAKRSQNAATKW